ncbi:hypothetical protein HDU76_004176 [Blyttiomyces sp. JEL0837]|nr:hypothetical protein HDU76_004176 [Blyttiomyces sp. JEL0837]
MLLDTGSSDVWVRSSDCKIPQNQPDDGSCVGPSLSPTDSLVTAYQLPANNISTSGSSSSSTPLSVSINYGTSASNPTSELTIQVYKTTLSFPGTDIKSTETVIGLGKIEYGLSNIDGILGLGFIELSAMSSKIVQSSGNVVSITDTKTNFIDNIATESSTSTQVQSTFGFYINGTGNGDFGEFTVGGYDSSNINGDIEYFDVVGGSSKGYWKLGFGGAVWGLDDGSGIGQEFSNGLNVWIVDTGSPQMVIDDDVAKNLNMALGASYFDSTQGLYALDCRKIPSLPGILITLGNKRTFLISPQYYVLQVDQRQCFTLFAPGGTSNGFAIIGVPLLQGYYSIFDKQQNRIGFAPSNQDWQPLLALGTPSSNPGNNNDLSWTHESWKIPVVACAAAFIFVSLGVILAVVIVRIVGKRRGGKSSDSLHLDSPALISATSDLTPAELPYHGAFIIATSGVDEKDEKVGNSFHASSGSGLVASRL